MRSAIIAAAVALLVSAAGATAATVITGAQIKDGSITSRDLQNGSIKRADLAKGARAKRGPAGPAGLKGDTGAPGPQGPQGDPGAAKIYMTWSTDVVTAQPGTVAVAHPTCPRGTAVGVTYSLEGNTSDDPHAAVTAVTLHETGASVDLRNYGTAPIQFSASITCVDTRPFD